MTEEEIQVRDKKLSKTEAKERAQLARLEGKENEV